MLSLRNSGSMQRAATSFPDPELCRLLALRMAQLEEDASVDLGDLVHFLVVQPGDTFDAIDAELGFSPIVNFVDESRYGEPDFMPSWEWIERHNGWFELAFVLSDDGFGWIVFVQDADGVDPELRAMCNSWAG